jgi:hypothetical protein
MLFLHLCQLQVQVPQHLLRAGIAGRRPQHIQEQPARLLQAAQSRRRVAEAAAGSIALHFADLW